MAFAAMPGTAVGPTWSSRTATGPSASAMRRSSPSACEGQPASYSTMRTAGAKRSCSEGDRSLPDRGPPSAGRATAVGLDRRYVDGLRALVAGFGVVLDLGALGERAEAARVDPRVVDEEVLAALVRGDEAEALVVVEPLDG